MTMTPAPAAPAIEGEEMQKLAELSAAASAGEWRYSPGPNFDEADIVATVNGYPAEICNFYCATGADEFEALPGKANAAFVATLVNSFRSGPLAQLRSDLQAARDDRDEALREHTNMMWQRRRADERAEAAESTASQLSARVRELEEALRPFARALSENSIRGADLRAARSALASSETEKRDAT